MAGSPTAASTSEYLTVSDSVTAANGATGTSFTVQFYLSTDATITTSDVAICSRVVAGIAAGEISTGTTSCYLSPTLTARTYYLGAIVDSGNAVAEAVETNNAAAGNQIAVSRPDLTVTSLVGAPTAVSMSDELTITDVVAATGGSTPTAFTVQYYLSTDMSITTADMAICTRTVEGLAAGATSTGTTTCAVPPTLAPRTYYLGAIVDSGNAVPESIQKAQVSAVPNCGSPQLQMGSLS